MWLWSLIIGILYYLFIILLAFAIVFGIYFKLKRRKEFMALSDEQKLVLAEGKQNVKEYRLRNFFITDEGSKMFNAGKIVACIQAEGENSPKLNFTIIAVRPKLLKLLRFYKVDSNYIDNLVGDVKCSQWNFRIDDKSYYYILNVKDLLKHEEIADKKRVGIDTVANITPVVTHAIQLNAEHRIKMREGKLIKEPTMEAGKDLSYSNTMLNR